MTTFNDLLNVIEQVYNATKIHVAAETNPEITEGMNMSLDLMESALMDAGRFTKESD